jgi:hypothetical protein
MAEAARLECISKIRFRKALKVLLPCLNCNMKILLATMTIQRVRSHDFRREFLKKAALPKCRFWKSLGEIR